MTGKRDSQSDVNVPGSAAFRSALTDATDRCVKCALCLPHCPTYARDPTETQSPRGRVSLVAALAARAIEADDARASLDSCLSCRACEQVCPARVAYGSILDRGKALLGGPSPTERWAAGLLRRPRLVRSLALMWRVTRRLPLPRRLRRWQALPGTAPNATAIGIGRSPKGRRVTVLVGCLSGDFDRAAVAAFERLFAAVDQRCEVIYGCCGALDQHSGARDKAATQGRALLRQIPADDSPIVHLASGCATAVRDLPQYVDSPQARAISRRVTDPFLLLEKLGIHESLNAAAKSVTRVALHLPCTQRNVLAAGKALERILASLEGVDAKPVTGKGCCGAAGTHMLRDPKAASDFASEVLGEVPADAELLLSANIGCAWHLRGALFDRQTTLPVAHPAVFLADRLSA